MFVYWGKLWQWRLVDHLVHCVLQFLGLTSSDCLHITGPNFGFERLSLVGVTVKFGIISNFGAERTRNGMPCGFFKRERPCVDTSPRGGLSEPKTSSCRSGSQVGPTNRRKEIEK